VAAPGLPLDGRRVNTLRAVQARSPRDHILAAHERPCTRVADLGGGTVHLIWVRPDAATLRHRLAARGSERDSAKLADFGNFTASMRLDDRPAAPHTAIDNRLTPAAALEDQVATLIASLSDQPGTGSR
jgi:hypothetical protein